MVGIFVNAGSPGSDITRMTTPAKLSIDFVSDVSCPWCAIGLQSLLSAIERIGPELDVTLRFQPFELNPGMAAEGEDIDAHLSKKYGTSTEQNDANRDTIRQRGESVGFAFNMAQRTRIYNTFDAHRLLHWAGSQGQAPQLALKQALLKAYFTEGRNPSDHAVLLDVVRGVGMDVDEAAAILADPERLTPFVRKHADFFRQGGINAVPAIVINDHHVMQGGQPTEVFERALRHYAGIAA